MGRPNEEVRTSAQRNGEDGSLESWTDSTRDFYSQMRWLEEAGIVVRRIKEGLIDFPSKREGKDVFLCWRLGEESVDFWHDLESGFGGRQPLS